MRGLKCTEGGIFLSMPWRLDVYIITSGTNLPSGPSHGPICRYLGHISIATKQYQRNPPNPPLSELTEVVNLPIHPLAAVRFASFHLPLSHPPQAPSVDLPSNPLTHKPNTPSVLSKRTSSPRQSPSNESNPIPTSRPFHNLPYHPAHRTPPRLQAVPTE